MDEFYKYFTDKFSIKIRKEIKELYLGNEIDNYENMYRLFVEKYGKNAILASLITKYLKNIEETYKYNKNITSTLFNNYILKVLKNSIISKNKHNTYYNNVEELMEIQIDNLNNIELYGSYTKREWIMILESFYDIYKERLDMYL